jgi:hypothetical protein
LEARIFLRKRASPPSKISRLTSADRRLASDHCGKIVTLLESYVRCLEGLRKGYYRGALRYCVFRQSLPGATLRLDWRQEVQPDDDMDHYANSLRGDFSRRKPVDGRAGTSQPRAIAAGSVADMPRLSKFVRASDLRILLLAFLGRQNALHMFHLAMFSEAILSMDAEVA